MDSQSIGASYCSEGKNHSFTHSFTMIIANGMSSQYLRYSLSPDRWYLKLSLVIMLPKDWPSNGVVLLRERLLFSSIFELLTYWISQSIYRLLWITVLFCLENRMCPFHDIVLIALYWRSVLKLDSNVHIHILCSSLP